MNANGAISFFLSDHLGSTAITVEDDGDFHGELRYSAWGETREDIGDTPTSRRFTGQAQEELLGIYFFEARWFDPYITQFTQPDSIIPDPYNPQDWNRYAYVGYNPINFNDPSGHCRNKCLYGGGDGTIPWEQVIKNYGIDFVGTWNDEQIAWVIIGVVDVGTRLEKSSSLFTSSAQAFKETYGINEKNKFQFVMGSCSARSNGNGGTYGGCGDPAAGAFTWSSREVEFAANAPFSSSGPYRPPWIATRMNINQVVHELGHAYASRHRLAYEKVSEKPELLNSSGYYEEDGYPNVWRPNTSTEPHETWANMYVGWVYGKWATDPFGLMRSDFMVTNMTEWIH